MYFLALATDYDGTIAHDGVVDDKTVDALKALKQSGRSLIMVTGREMPDLHRVCPHLDLFDRIVAENGAYLYTPESKSGRSLSPAPPPAFVERLQARGVQPLSVGESIVATWEPNETVVLEVIRDLGLDLQITFNKGAVMVLPAGINKASGLAAAVGELGLSAHNVVAVGDAENDLAFMRTAGCAVAVGNALDPVKAACDLVMTQARGAGVAELIARLRDNETDVLQAALPRHVVRVGETVDGVEVVVGPLDGAILITGSSGGGKSTLATALLERMMADAFQVCVFDPEGDYAELDGAVVFGDAKTPINVDQVIDALADPGADVAVNMLGTNVDGRPDLFRTLFPAVLDLEMRTGRPHWILVDEAHHMMPPDVDSSGFFPQQPIMPAIFVTVHPESVRKDALERIGTLLSIGTKAQEAVRSFCRATGRAEPPTPGQDLQFGEAIYWRVDTAAPLMIRWEKPQQARTRHIRKYADGQLGEDRSFYFRGPAGALNLRAQNLMIFLQIADGIDEQTFDHHRREGDYSRWLETAIKDADLAAIVESIEGDGAADTAEARRRMREAIEARYTAPSH